MSAGIRDRGGHCRRVGGFEPAQNRDAAGSQDTYPVTREFGDPGRADVRDHEVLLAGKSLSGLVAATVIFCLSVLVQWVCKSAHFPSDLLNSHMFGGPGMSHLVSCVLAAALACIGYGSVFLWAKLRYRNPLLPAALILVWEGANGIVPALLKKVIVIYWLKSICPISIPALRGNDNNFFNLLVFDIDPAPASDAIVNLLLIAAFVLAWGAMQARKLEISYGSD